MKTDVECSAKWVYSGPSASGKAYDPSTIEPMISGGTYEMSFSGTGSMEFTVSSGETGDWYIVYFLLGSTQDENF